MVQFTPELPIHDLNDKEMHTRSLNLDDNKQRVFSLATAMEFPFALQSTMRQMELNIQ